MEHRKIAGYTNCVGVYINYGIGQYNGIHDSFGVNWIVNRSGCGCGWGSCTACDGKHIIRLVNVCKWSGLVMHDVNWTDRHIHPLPSWTVALYHRSDHHWPSVPPGMPSPIFCPS